MCIIIDANAIPPVFNQGDSCHGEFSPVEVWIRSGKGKMVYGGTTYRNQLRRLGKYIPILYELDFAGKIIKIDHLKVDQAEADVVKRVMDSRCDDHHIIALVIVSGCKLLCSNDHSSFVYIKEKSYYPSGTKPPKIYTGNKNSNLLVNKNIVTCKNVATYCVFP
jgi:hypothetical protein